MGKTFRWKARYSVLSVLFVAWIVSFLDRMAMSVAIPYIAADFSLTPVEMGGVMSAFFASYSLSQIPGGLLGDIVGVRKVATVAMLWWSAFTAITGAAGNLLQMLIARFVFGLGEGVYPACLFKTVAVWFPRKERATANAVKFAAGPLGAALSPLVVGAIMSVWGWRAVFYCLCLPGVLVAALFWKFVPDDPAHRATPEELAEIEEDDIPASQASAGKLSFREILRQPHIVKYFLILFCFDIAYWGFSTWLPTYLIKARGFSLGEMGVAASLPFFAGALGCLFGGWISDRFFTGSRRTPIIVTQLASALLLYASFIAKSSVMLILCQTLAGLALNVFFTAFWALPMTTVPKQVMGVISGFINMAGQIAAFISPLLIGFLVQVAGGGFGLTFLLLIAAILASCALVFTIPAKVDPSGGAPQVEKIRIASIRSGSHSPLRAPN